MKTGDEIALTTVSSREVPQEALRFQEEKERYQSKSLKVSALASRPLAKVDTYIGNCGCTAWNQSSSYNELQYLIAARKREFGIFRPMGITDTRFRKMIAKERLRYGIYSGMTVMIIYCIVQKPLYYFMIHVYLYLHPKTFISWEVLVAVILSDIVICVGVTLMPGNAVAAATEEEIVLTLAEEIF